MQIKVVTCAFFPIILQRITSVTDAMVRSNIIVALMFTSTSDSVDNIGAFINVCKQSTSFTDTLSTRSSVTSKQMEKSQSHAKHLNKVN